MTLLDIGPGDLPLDGFIGVDPYRPGPASSVHVHAWAWSLPYPDSSVAVLHSSHQLEHVIPENVERCLREWRRVLEPGGQLWLEVPNFDWVARYWLGEEHHPDTPAAQHLIFGLQSGPGQAHHYAFSASTLRLHLELAGFTCTDRSDAEIQQNAPWGTLPTNVIFRVWSHHQQCLRVRCLV